MSNNVYSKKSYGLLLSNKVANAVQKTKNVFGDDSDSEGEASGTTDWMRKKLQTEAKKKSTTKKVEDESIYQYDEVYESMQEEKEKESVKYRNNQVEGKKPKYIGSLLKSAEERERERERRIERKVEKERREEGDQFKDKESFVTSAYREKMEEMERLQEEERKKDALDNLCDVTKQKDMSGFYRHLYRQTMGEEKGQQEQKEEIKKIDKSSKKYRAKKVESSDEESSDESSEEEEPPTKEEQQQLEHHPQSREEKVEEMRLKLKLEREKREARKRRIDRGEDSSEEETMTEEKKTKITSKEEKDQPSSGSSLTKEVEKKPKKDVWKKITVGKVFDDAVQRYFERKAQRTQFPLL